MMRLNGIHFNLHNEALHAAKPYPVEEYLDDVFNMVWKPLNGSNKEQENFRRYQQRAYIDFIGMGINPTQEKTAASSPAALRSDAVIYLEQHLDRVEQYLKQQEQTPHYRNLLLRIKKIREKYESGK